MEKLRVPQRKVGARVLLRDGRELEGELYVPDVGPVSAHGSLTERLVDRTEVFLPFADNDGGCLLNKAWITSIRLAPADAGPELPESPSEHHVKVRLRLAGGAEISGTVDYTMPPEKGRLLDYLNSAPRFVLVLENGGIVLVNREHIVEADRLEPEGA